MFFCVVFPLGRNKNGITVDVIYCFKIELIRDKSLNLTFKLECAFFFLFFNFLFSLKVVFCEISLMDPAGKMSEKSTKY